jgi:hypothetical protein
MIHHRLMLCTLCVVLPTAAVSGAQERTAVHVSIGGNELPAEVQPRVIVEQQLGAADQARIQVTGRLGVAYAGLIATGDEVDIAALGLAGASIPIFKGEVVSLEPGFDQAQPFVLIHASSTLPRVESESRPPVTLTPGPGGDARLLAFLSRLSSTSSLQEVLVNGVDASTGGPIIGRAVAPTILLGPGPDVLFGDRLVIETDRRFSSADEADAFAAAVLSERLATRISAEVLTPGNPDLGIGSFVEIEGLDAEFDGAYYVAGVSHRIGPDSYGGYSSAFRLRRADLGMFRLPEIDDEVLVAFEHGDFTKPYSVGSWWDCDAKPPSERPDRDPCRLLRWPW